MPSGVLEEEKGSGVLKVPKLPEENPPRPKLPEELPELEKGSGLFAGRNEGKPSRSLQDIVGHRSIIYRVLYSILYRKVGVLSSYSMFYCFPENVCVLLFISTGLMQHST